MLFFRNVGDNLKVCFDFVIKVIIGNSGDWLIKEGEIIKFLIEFDLVYIIEFLNFCKVDFYMGYYGIVGRWCNDISMGVGGC